MELERIDLGPIDPTANPAVMDRLVGGIMERAAPELRRRATAANPLAVLALWVRPTLAAAAVLVVISGSALFFAGAGPVSVPTPGTGIAEALSLPESLTPWIVGEREPSATDLYVALRGEIE
jgi:hypothetical protein